MLKSMSMQMVESEPEVTMATHTLKVTPVQVAAARLRLSIDQQLGRVSSPAVVRIAGARPKAPPPNVQAPSPQA